MFATAVPSESDTGAVDDGAVPGKVNEDIHRSHPMRHDEIEQPLTRSRAAMAHGATAQMDARARRDDADAELDRLEDAITAAGNNELHAVASAYFQATRSRVRKDQQAWEDAQQRYRAARGDAA